MPENTATVDENATQGAPAENARTFTQQELDAIVGDRLKRERAKYADYGELAEKARAYDAAQEASKSELQKAVERAERAEAELTRMREDAQRAQDVARIAAEKGVDAEVLARMGGDVSENAEWLAQRAKAESKYPTLRDGGEKTPRKPAKDTGDEFAEWFKANTTISDR